ncbi:MAG TPA: farnesyl diphosphate synthase [Bacillota bacterium]|nr:farnesyl diphosphate synthase [Bacillota bacterium]
MIDGYDRLRRVIEDGLDRFLPATNERPSSIHQAMRYSACGGGKRLRGICTLITAELVGGKEEWAVPTACALEMIHAYSLIHDDLPCMDDDDLRRGKPTNHKVYGEATALLAGNGLLTQAITTILRYTPAEVSKEAVLKVVLEISEAVGSQGMLGGQVFDLEAEGKVVPLAHLQEIHRMKTGALLLASLRCGAILGGASQEQLAALTEYGKAFGLAFQITDDLLDVIGSTEILGKPVGSDDKNQKSTYPVICGIERSKSMAQEEVTKAQEAIAVFGTNAISLYQMADYLLTRDR